MTCHRTRTDAFGAACLLTGCLCLLGCDSLQRTPKFANPVVGPPPTRVANLQPDGRPADGIAFVTDTVATADAEVIDDGTGDSKVRTISLSGQSPDLQDVASGEVAALVNGQPIFVDDVLEPFAAGLQKTQSQISPQEMRQLRRDLVKKHLKPHIERQLLLQALKAKLKPEQMTMLEKHLEGLFDEEVQKMMKEMDVSTTGEMDVELHNRGSSLNALKTSFRNQKMAQQYLAMQSAPKEGFDRRDLLEYYQQNIADYEIAGEVRWQQIVISFEKHGGKGPALLVAREVQTQLADGANFGELARKYSTGVNAATGGEWGWTKMGSLSVPEVETALFTLPVGTVSNPIEGPRAYEIVKVVERHEPGRQSFESVQADIKQALREGEFRRSADELIARLSDRASIDILIDGDRE